MICNGKPGIPLLHGNQQMRQNVLEELLNIKNLPEKPSKIDFDDIAFVTAISSNHFQEAKSLFSSFRDNFYKQTLLLYDIGLGEAEVKEITGNYKNVELIKFNFNKYPEYVRKLEEYRWKPLIIAEALKHYKAVFYMDASVVWQNGKLLDTVLYKISTGVLNPVVLFHRTNFSNFQVTHFGMLKYFNCPATVLRSTEQFGATIMLFVRTRDVMQKVVLPFAFCALDKDCMSPRGSSTKCSFKSKNAGQKTSPNCHRFDQSAINLILGAVNGFNVAKYADLELDGRMFVVARTYVTVEQVRDFFYGND